MLFLEIQYYTYFWQWQGGGGTQALKKKNRPRVVFKFLGPPCPIHLVTQWYIGNFLVPLTMCFVGDTPTKLGLRSLQGIWGGQRIKTIMNMMSYFYI